MTRYCCINNKSITLNCKYATIDDTWCYATTTANSNAPDTLNICEDWQTSLSLQYAGFKQNEEWYEDLFENKLATITTGKYIKIPSGMFTILNTKPCTVEGFTGTWIQYANSKGWTITS